MACILASSKSLAYSLAPIICGPYGAKKDAGASCSEWCFQPMEGEPPDVHWEVDCSLKGAGLNKADMSCSLAVFHAATEVSHAIEAASNMVSVLSLGT